MFGLAFGLGLTRKIECAYAFLMHNWQPGDRVFLFGFSRGAYTARALARLLHMFGLLAPSHEKLLPLMQRREDVPGYAPPNLPRARLIQEKDNVIRA